MDIFSIFGLFFNCDFVVVLWVWLGGSWCSGLLCCIFFPFFVGFVLVVVLGVGCSGGGCVCY